MQHVQTMDRKTLLRFRKRSSTISRNESVYKRRRFRIA